MDPGSSPAITVIASTGLLDGYAVAYEGSDDLLYTFNSIKQANTRINLNLSARTGPGAAADGLIGPDGTGEIQVSFRANTSALWRVTPDISFQESWTVSVAANTTPSVAAYILAFQGGDGRLWTESQFAFPVSTGQLMAAGTSPDLF